jgi:phosphate:Na+ symporter
VPVIVNYLAGDPVSAFLLAALVTWMFHSSVASILLLVALSARGLVPVELGIVMVLGANLGGGLIAAMLSRTMAPAARTVPLGNLVLRGAGATLALAGLVDLRAAAQRARRHRRPCRSSTPTSPSTWRW